IKNDRVVTCGAAPDFVKWVGFSSPGSLPDSHVYTVLGYDPATKQVTVRNPWGSMGDGPLKEAGATKDGVTHLGDGKLQMSLDTFYNRFSDMEISGKDPTVNAIRNAGRSAVDSAGFAIDFNADLYSGRPLDALNDAWRGYQQS